MTQVQVVADEIALFFRHGFPTDKLIILMALVITGILRQAVIIHKLGYRMMHSIDCTIVSRTEHGPHLTDRTVVSLCECIIMYDGYHSEKCIKSAYPLQRQLLQSKYGHCNRDK